MADLNMSPVKCHDKFMAGEEFFVAASLLSLSLLAMNFRSALPPAKQPKRRINAPVGHCDAENILSLGLCVISTAGRIS
jgi:hypothetical protein